MNKKGCCEGLRIWAGMLDGGRIDLDSGVGATVFPAAEFGC